MLEATEFILIHATVIAQVIVVAALIGFASKDRLNNSLLKWLGKNALTISFVVALVATLGSLFYSEALGYSPCKLCWYQRILMYPQVFLLGLALYRAKKQQVQDILSYTIILTVLGAIIALYHYSIQFTGAEILPCSAVGYTPACSTRFTMHYGYITIPMMSLSAFALLWVTSAAEKLRLKKPSN